MNDLIEEVKKEFAFYGFVTTPLKDNQIKSLLERGYDLNAIYNIGSDINCGVEVFDATINKIIFS